MSKIPGVGYNPGPGTVFWVWPGGAAAGTTKFNPAAGDPFGTGSAGTLDLAVFNARYGGRPVRGDGTIGLFVLDAETVLGVLTRAMELAAEKGTEPEFKGKPSTHTMVPTLRESHDYAATHSDGGRSLLGIVGPVGTTPPGQPRITKISSPSPGHIELTWVTGVATAFQIKAGSFEVPFPDPNQGNTRTGIIELPPGLGGELEVTVRAFRDGVPGKWSQAKKVKVEPRDGGGSGDPGGTGDPTEEQRIQAIRQSLQGVEADLTAFGTAGADKKALVQSIRQKLQGTEAELKEIEKGL